MVKTFVARTFDGAPTGNRNNTPDFPLLFQIAPGAGAGLGIAGVPFTIDAAGQTRLSGTTTAEGAVMVPGSLLNAGPVTVRIFDTDYTVQLEDPDLGGTALAGSQKRLDVLGYMTGVLLDAAPDTPANNGALDTRTMQATLNFQTDRNSSDGSIAIDADLGDQTRRALRREAGF
jgi:hypothetical protein